MKVGDYVRNKYGIAKIIDIENKRGIDILVFDNDICFLVNRETRTIKDGKLYNKLPIINEYIDLDKLNMSPNIIDLIEVGDYVNRERVIGFGEMVNVEEQYTQRLSLTLENTISCLPEDIKTIVTKEQIEQIEYKIGE